jgi:hypothetical protein
MGIERNAVVLLLPNEIATMRVSVGNKTAFWAVNTKQMLWVPGAGPFAFELQGNIIGAEFNEALDERVSNQRKSIDEMLSHLKVHCPKLMGTGDCSRIGAL